MIVSDVVGREERESCTESVCPAVHEVGFVTIIFCCALIVTSTDVGVTKDCASKPVAVNVMTVFVSTVMALEAANEKVCCVGPPETNDTNGGEKTRCDALKVRRTYEEGMYGTETVICDDVAPTAIVVGIEPNEKCSESTTQTE